MTPSPKRNRQRAIAKRVARMLGDRTLCPRCQATHADLGGGVRPVCPWAKPHCVGEATVRGAVRWAKAARQDAEARRYALAGAALVAMMLVPIWRLLP